MKSLEESIRLALNKGRENWVDYINSLDDDEKTIRFYCCLYNRRNGSNYQDEYILRGRSPATIRLELLDLNYSEDAPERLAEAIRDYENQESNYSFSYITRLGYDSNDTLFDAPTLEWLETIEGFSWVCYHL